MRGILSKYGFFEEIVDIIPLQESKKKDEIRCIYQVDLKGSLKLICRVSKERRFHKELIEQQSCFSEQLRLCGVPVAKKYKSDDGYCITYKLDSFLCCVTLEEYVGEDIKIIDINTFERLGQILGQMHTVSEQNPFKINYSHIFAAITNGRARFTNILRDEETTSCAMGISYIEEIAKIHDRLVSLIKRAADKLPRGAVHGDLGILNNIVVNQGDIFIIDFNLAGEELFLFDMLSCFYSSIHKYSWREALQTIDYDEAYFKFISGYCSQRELSASEKEAFGIVAALFDGLFYSKAIVEEYNITKDRTVFSKFRYAHKYFDILNHDFVNIEQYCHKVLNYNAGSCRLLEYYYQKFQDDNPVSRHASDVEYIGVNFSDDVAVGRPVFKAYYTTERSFENVDQILSPLMDRNMIHGLNRIDDTISDRRIRYEIGLQNRTNQNMEFIYKWLLSMSQESKNHREELAEFCKIKCTQSDDYKYAGLYYIGLIADMNVYGSLDTKAVKYHYLLRHCSNPDKIGKNYIVDNEFFFNILHDIQIPEIQQITLFLKELLDRGLGELWIAAVDYYKGNFSKYKIYFKNFSPRIYDIMVKKFTAIGCTNLAEQIETYTHWICFHPELERYGIAVCLDSNGVWSVNFYH